jgi:hypothetical protein
MQLKERVRNIPFPTWNRGGGMDGVVGVVPVFRPVRDKNFPTGRNRAGDLQTGRTGLLVHNKTSIGFGPGPGGVSRGTNTTKKGGINKKGRRDLEAINANIFSGVSPLHLNDRKGLTKIINQVITFCPGGQGEQTITSPLNCRWSHIQVEGGTEMEPAKRGMDIRAPGTTKTGRRDDGAMKKLERAFERGDRTF